MNQYEGHLNWLVYREASTWSTYYDNCKLQLGIYGHLIILKSSNESELIDEHQH